jgi:hypothetical protein
VCQSDAFVQLSDQAFRAAGAAAAFGAGGVRVRWDCEDGNDDQHERRLESYVAFESFQSEYAGIDDGDGESVECECSGGWVGAVYRDGYGESEYERDMEREWNRGRVGYGRDDFCEWELHGAREFAESRFIDYHGDQRCDDLG